MKPSPRSKIGLDELVEQNVAAITRIEAAALSSRTRADMVADAIAGFCGSIIFVYVHVVFFAVWLLWNTLPAVPKHVRFDQPPFNMLTLIVSLEAIFLSTFILISQNRQQRTADQRNHLDLQINLLAEQESSQMLSMMKQVMDHLGIPVIDRTHEALEQATDPEKLAEQIQKAVEGGLPDDLPPSPNPDSPGNA
ncbi:MAG TPA: DUF1003 domain-containing protein [Fimbriimonas sp.]|nr:DUF1003 domain-containing protein [Fimbriimonas sp.]